MNYLWISAAILAVLFVSARYIEQRNLYFPIKTIVTTPAAMKIAYEDVRFKTSDGLTLHGWYFDAKSDRTLLFCHGNGGNVSHRAGKAAMLMSLGVNVLLFDYRGYGNSEGKPGERGLYRDGEAAWDYLVKERKADPAKIILYGESLGGAVVVDLASKGKGSALITEGTFSSIPDMVKIIYPFMPSGIVASRYDSLSKIGRMNIPKLIIHSVDDEITPFALSRKLFDAAGEPKYFVQLRGSHNTAFWDSQDEWLEGIRRFIA